ncbi:MAG: hypothetical protein COS47_00550 [Candidatus Nealsonbacteria bacterium CG03_land_8_20_14_0_80_36_12]|uniref:Adenylate kinase n=1 Tax=Candidatus Nealsonbacteria bacterium CG03_land_8_20_14_0_80_36_12 TaxID=1974701 RepID=A0A2M7BYQ1_9BACT|nr:MAG: hypothetical protein COS47_00550 [Candidatus Nealsonbacteria bacterium CG03_land_8_20_14_0_80_36_12]
MLNSQKLVIILLGPPGSGKGTLATLLAEKFDLYYFETSKVIEANVMKAKSGDFLKVGSQKYNLLKEKNFWKTGMICSPLLVGFWIKQKIKKLAKEGEGIVLAGSPRTLPEGKEEIPLLKKLYGSKNIKVVLVEISAQESIWRNSHRRICQLMRHPIIYAKETAQLKRCPLDGSRLVRRKGLDEPETIKVRLKEYKEKTLPLIEYFKKQGLRTRKINGKGSVEVVFKRVLKSLRR